MIIVFELVDESLEVTVDGEGIDYLVRILTSIQNGGHEHLASPSWAGSELAETPMYKNSTVIHQVTFARRPDNWGE
jgi:hypothetical protein